MAINEES